MLSLGGCEAAAAVLVEMQYSISCSGSLCNETGWDFWLMKNPLPICFRYCLFCFAIYSVYHYTDVFAITAKPRSPCTVCVGDV